MRACGSFRVLDTEWAKSVSFDEFCEYILPYKSANEKPEKGWRTKLYDEYSPMYESISNRKSPLELCIRINNNSPSNWDVEPPLNDFYGIKLIWR